MALARLVTRTPEFAHNLARSLEEAGYSVEFASPDIVSHGALVGLPLDPADLEVNLDDPSAASSYLMTADGKEISFAYDPCEREFVLAPAWRSFKAAIAPVAEALRSHLSAEWNVRRNTIANSRLRQYDAAWSRAVPVAVIITLAFLFGWASSDSQPTSPAPAAIAVNDVEKLHQASVVPVATAPALGARSAASAKATPTRRVSRKSTANVYDEDAEDDDAAPDVVIRHYPAKNARTTAQASAQKPSVKRISDLD